MKSLLDRMIYQPGLILPLLLFTQLMVALDFSVTQVSLVLLARSARIAYRWIYRASVPAFVRAGLARLLSKLRALPRLEQPMHECGCKG